MLCATFSWRFFSVKGLEQKIDRFVDYFHCPLEDEVDNWWEKNYTSSNTYNYTYTHSYLYNLKFIHSVHKQYPCFLLWYFQWLVLNFQTGRLKIIVMCIVLQNFKRNSNTQHLLLVLKEINNVVCYAKLPYPCPPPRY